MQSPFYAARSQKTTCGSLFFPPPMWLPDIKLKPTVLVAFATICLLRHLVGPDNVVYPGSETVRWLRVPCLHGKQNTSLTPELGIYFYALRDTGSNWESSRIGNCGLLE